VDLEKTRTYSVVEYDGQTVELYCTDHYTMTRAVPPNCSPEWLDDRYKRSWVFGFAGPGWDRSKCYVASTESCGKNLLETMEACFSAGMVFERERSNDK
jgi:hypothetical protein